MQFTLHLFGGLFFLLCTIVLLFLYFALPYGFVAGLNHFRKKRKMRKARESLDGFCFNWKRHRKIFLFVSIILLVLNSSIYLRQRSKWMGEDNNHLKAKDYWVAGQVVYLDRFMAGKMLHPDNSLLTPFKYLQKKIYEQGVKYLPENDGEKYVWYNHWFVYPYARKFQRPHGIGNKEFEPEMVSFLDSCWEAMEHLTTKEMTDPDMKRKHLLGFPFLLSYYATFQGHYTGKYTSSGTRTRTHPLYRQRNYQMLEWLDNLKHAWDKTDLFSEILSKNPYIAALHQVTVNELLQNITLALPLEGTFQCDHPIILRAHKELQDIMSADPKRNTLLFLKRKKPKQADTAYSTTVYSPTGSAVHYMLDKICNKMMPQELKLLRDKSYRSHHISDNSTEKLFREELKPLIKGKI